MIIHGRYSYGNPILRGEKSNVYTGAFCSISDLAIFDCGFQHNSNFITTFPLNQKLGLNWEVPQTKGDIRIGNDVWIGENAIIMSGVDIPDGCIIAAGAVVTKSIREVYSIYAGVPARLKKYRFTEEQIKKLLDIKWWDRPEEWIRENAPLLMSGNIDQCI